MVEGREKVVVLQREERLWGWGFDVKVVAMLAQLQLIAIGDGPLVEEMQEGVL